MSDVLMSTDEEIERDRQEWLEAHALEFMPHHYAPGTHGCHEALHVASVLANMIDDTLCSHPAVLSNSEFYRLARRAHEVVFNLYQGIGSEHLAPKETR